MSWSDTLDAAERRELLADIYEFEPKTAFAYVTLKTRLGFRGSLPFDERLLASMVRCTRAWWSKHVWPALKKLFVVRDGLLFDAGDDAATDGATDLAAARRPEKATTIAARKAANVRHAKDRALKEAARQAAGAASDPHESRMRSASNPHMRGDAAFVGNQDLGHAEDHADSHAEIMRGASFPHASAYAPARAPSLSPTDSVLSNPVVQPAIPGDSKQIAGKESLEGVGVARADAHDAQACGSDADAHAQPCGKDAGAMPTHPDYKEKNRLKKAARQATNISLPDDWQPTPDSIALARELGHNVEVLAADFRDHYRDSGERKSNWDGAFSKWVRREVVFDPEKLKQSHLTMPIAGGAAGQPKAAAPPTPEDEAVKARVAAAEAWAGPELAAQWARVRGQMRVRVGPVAWRTWLDGMALGALDGDEVILHLPSGFVRDHAVKEYAGHLTQLWRAERPGIRRVELRVGPARNAGSDAAPQGIPPKTRSVNLS